MVFEADRVGLYCLFWLLYWVDRRPMDHNTNVEMPNLYNRHLSPLLILNIFLTSDSNSAFNINRCFRSFICCYACSVVMLAPKFSRFSVDALEKEDPCWFLPNSWPKAAQARRDGNFNCLKGYYGGLCWTEGALWGVFLDIGLFRNLNPFPKKSQSRRQREVAIEYS